MLLQGKPCHASIKSHFVHFLTKLHLIGSLKFWGVIPFLAFAEQIQIWVLVKKQMKVTQTCWFLSLVLFYFVLVRLHLQLLTNQNTDFFKRKMQHCLKCLLKFIWKEFWETWLQNPQFEKLYSQTLTTKPAVQILISEQHKSSVIPMVLVELLQFYTAVTGNWTWNFAFNFVQKWESRKKVCFRHGVPQEFRGSSHWIIFPITPHAFPQKKCDSKNPQCFVSSARKRKIKHGLPGIHIQRLNLCVRHLIPFFTVAPWRWISYFQRLLKCAGEVWQLAH